MPVLCFRTIADLDLNARVSLRNILPESSAQSCCIKSKRSSHFDASDDFRHSDEETMALAK